MLTERFQWITGTGERPSFEAVLSQSDHFVVLPSLGSLVVGWLLVVPRRRMPNLSFLTPAERTELQSLVNVLVMRLNPLGKIYFFEHGANYGSTHACGVDQAHLHLVPLKFDLVETALQTKNIHWSKEVGSQVAVDAVQQSNEYLWMRQAGHVSYRGKPSTAVSQWFRRHIATHTGRSEQWNYKIYPKLEIIKQTFDFLSV